MSLPLTLALVGAPLGAMADLVVDGGATYTVTAAVTPDNEYIDQNSTGTLIQGGFTNTVNSDLELGQNPGAIGAYNLSGGRLLAGSLYVGDSGTGNFAQTV